MPLITLSEGTPLLPPGSYDASLVRIAPKRLVSQYTNPPGQEQDFLEWTWLVDGNDGAVEITSLTTLATGPKSKIMAYLVALVGAEKAQVGAGFDENDLVGKQVVVQTSVDDKGFSKIEGVVAPVKRKAGNGAPKTIVVEAAPENPAPVVIAEPTADADLTDDLPF